MLTPEQNDAIFGFSIRVFRIKLIAVDIFSSRLCVLILDSGCRFWLRGRLAVQAVGLRQLTKA
jgi:hypothetical protein